MAFEGRFQMIQPRPPPDPRGFIEAARFRYTSSAVEIPIRHVQIPPGTVGLRLPEPKVAEERRFGVREALRLPPAEVTSVQAQPRSVSFESLVWEGMKGKESMRDVDGYKATVVDVEWRMRSAGSEAKVKLFKIDVQRGAFTWVVYRRFRQFRDLHALLKRKVSGFNMDGSLLKRSNDSIPSQIVRLNQYVSSLQPMRQVVSSHYYGNFFEPINMGDGKKVKSEISVAEASNPKDSASAA